jgi:predicted translin family RNA/ssDNA-binding protein
VLWQNWAPGIGTVEVAPVTAEEALAEIGKVNELLRELDAKLRLVPSSAVPQLQQEIAEAMARKGWLFEQIPRMEGWHLRANPEA